MPLHVDRTSVQPHLHGHGHVLDRPAARPVAAAKVGGDAVAADAATITLAAVAAPAADVSSVDEADRLVRSLLQQGTGRVVSAHSSLDPARIHALLAS